MKSAFVKPFGKFEFKKVPFGLVQALTHFKQLINLALKGLPLLLNILKIFWCLVKTKNNITNICELFDRL